MTKTVLDASALWAWLEDEPGAERVQDVLASGGAVMSAVTWAEVLAKLADRGVSDDDRRRIRGALDLEIRPFDEQAAFVSATLRALSKALVFRAIVALSSLRRSPRGRDAPAASGYFLRPTRA